MSKTPPFVAGHRYVISSSALKDPAVLAFVARSAYWSPAALVAIVDRPFQAVPGEMMHVPWKRFGLRAKPEVVESNACFCNPFWGKHIIELQNELFDEEVKS